MKNFLKKFSNSLISGIGFGFGFLMIIGLYIAYATGVFNLPSQVGTGSGLSATEWNKMVGSLDNLNSRLTPEAWQTPTLQNGWTNYDLAWSSAGYFKDSNGVVHLKGIIKNGTILQCIFTLPVGYRPVAQGVFTILSSNNALGRIDITSVGCVIPNVGSNIWVSLDGLSFRAEQ